MALVRAKCTRHGRCRRWPSLADVLEVGVSLSLMKRVGSILLCLTSAFLGSGCHSLSLERMGLEHTKQEFISSLVGQDLRELDAQPKARLLVILNEVLPQQYGMRVAPWFIWHYPNAAGKDHFVMLTGRRLVCIPGNSGARVDVFDQDMNHLRTQGFSTGWRIDLQKASLITDGSGRSIIELTTLPGNNGREITRQLYGLIGDRLALLCLENSKGVLVRNNYAYPNHVIGPPVPRRTIDEWEAVLSSDGIFEIAEALTWLGSLHWDSGSPVRETTHESDAELDLVSGVHERVKRKLHDLAGSDVDLIRKAAALAADIEWYW